MAHRRFGRERSSCPIPEVCLDRGTVERFARENLDVTDFRRYNFETSSGMAGLTNSRSGVICFAPNGENGTGDYVGKAQTAAKSFAITGRTVSGIQVNHLVPMAGFYYKVSGRKR